jgi:tRNA-2-methylthio-N6-dimethylallyladenosine synthase
MNKVDSELTLGELRKGGFVPVDDPELASLVLFNTCSVRGHAEDRVFSRLGAFKGRKKKQPGFLLGVLGCMAEKERNAIFRAAPHVDLVCGPRDFPRILELVREAEAGRRPPPAVGGRGRPDLYRDVRTRDSRFQAFVTATRGCDKFCTFCIVPFTRGREVSRPVAEIVDEVQRLCDDGVREVTLLGQTIDTYGSDLPERPELADLLEAVHDVEGLDRIRFITAHPGRMTERLFRTMARLPKVCPYLHMPAQSGSDRVLEAMKRGYTVAAYREVVARARALLPEVAIASDFIVGFPGETDADFAATVALLEEVRFQQAFVFKYSPRPGTRGFRFPDDVPAHVKAARNQRMLEVQARVALEDNRRMHGRRFDVLVEGRSHLDPRRVTSRTPTNRIVVFEGEPSLEGQVVPVEIVDATALVLVGRRLPAAAAVAG